MKINLLYDYLGPEGHLPNALNPNYMAPIVNNGYQIDHKTLTEFENGVGAISVIKGISVIYPSINKYYCVSDIYDGFNDENRVIDEDELFLYVVAPYGGASATFGYEGTYNENKSFFHFISKNALQLIREVPNVFIYINYSNEGTIDLNWYQVIHDDAKKFDIPLEKIVFCASDYFIKMNYDLWKEMYKIDSSDSIKLMYLNWSLHDKAKEIYEISQGKKTKFNQYSNDCTVATESDIDLEKVREKKFLMFNRRLRPHRVYSICHYYEKGILDQFLVSYDISTLQMYDMNFENIEMHIEDREHQKYLLRGFYKLLKENPKQTIDYEDLENVWGFNFETKDPYLESYIHITSETNFFEIGGYFSEKTWKPIAHLQPFIFMGPASGLSKLKELGFKTFSPFINEEYDNCLDPEERFDKVIEEIERLSKIPIEEIHEWYKSIYQDVLVYNRDKFLEYRDHDINKQIINNSFKQVFYGNT